VRGKIKPEDLKVVALAHCILNQSTRWWKDGKELRRGLIREVIDALASMRIGAVQMPCPEFSFCGNPRPSRTKEEYRSLPGFMMHCRRLAKAMAENLKGLTTLSKRPKIKIVAVVGIERSPTCGVELTPYKRVGREEFEYRRMKGLFMEALEEELESLGISVPMLGLDLRKPEALVNNIKNVAHGC